MSEQPDQLSFATHLNKHQARQVLGITLGQFNALIRNGIFTTKYAGALTSMVSKAPIWDVNVLRPALEGYLAMLESNPAMHVKSKGARMPEFAARWGFSTEPYRVQLVKALDEMNRETEPTQKQGMKDEIATANRYISGMFIKMIKHDKGGNEFKDTHAFREFCLASPDFGRCVYGPHNSQKHTLIGCLCYPAKKDPTKPYGPNNIEWTHAKPTKAKRGRKQGFKLTETQRLIFIDKRKATRADNVAKFRKAYAADPEMQKVIPESMLTPSLRPTLHDLPEYQPKKD